MSESFIPFNRKSVWKAIAICIVAFAACTFLISKGYEAGGSRDYGPYVYYGVNTFVLVAATIGFLIMISALRKPDVGLHIDDTGFQYRSVLSNGPKYQWNNVAGFKSLNTKHMKLIFIYLQKQDEFESTSNSWQKWNRNSDIKHFGTPHKINTALLHMDHDDVLGVLNQKLLEFRSGPH